jgi:ATP-dependent RNA helicase SUPV3L1/SUV3
MSFEHIKHNLLAILGPTNTGKTYFAFERLTSYQSGMFGFPLRLLARENYDKAIAKLGINKVALITGEEKILPSEAKFFFCTVESMPLNIEVECIAIDEVQLAADYERGHIFTDRILHLRGTYETMFLGSTTIQKILLRLFPNIKIKTRERFSRLSFLPKRNLSKLKPRSAVIAFNINKIYEIAETLRKYKGGAAVVLGSLSPRTRNAQVEIYEDKKVDYLVATDAIGMGLNLNIDHVSFSSFTKFDGRYMRGLSPAEIGQIAGRAGRYQNDGTFSYTKEVDNLDPLIVQSIEDHRFDDIQKVYWRNSSIDFSSINSVINSFRKFPVRDFFIHKKNAEDELNFRLLSEDLEILSFLNNKTSISLLWDVCRIPDFQKIINDSYVTFLKNIFLNLIKNDFQIPEPWFADKIIRLDEYSGGIEELTSKIASIRTWTYISHQSNWIENGQYWQKKTRDIENSLSDHLHISLTNRFVDLSASYFVDAMMRGDESIIEVDSNKSIKINGQNYGYINGFNLKLNDNTETNSLFSLLHVKKSIRLMIDEKISDFLNAPNDSINLGEVQKFNLDETVNIYWGDEPVGQLVKGINIFSPKVEILNTELLESDKKILVIKKLQKWIDEKTATILKPITADIDETVSPEVRAIAFNLFNALGTMPIDKHINTVKKITEHDKATVSRMGIRIGAKFFFIPNFLKKNAMELNGILWRVYNKSYEKNLYPLPKDGRVSFVPNIPMSTSYWLAIGYICIDNFAVRVDVFERIFFLVRQKLKSGPFLESSDLMNPIGCNSQQLTNILSFCGCQGITLGDEKRIFFYKQKIKKKIKKFDKKNKKKIIKKNNKETFKREEKKIDPNSPFAVLQKIL